MQKRLAAAGYKMTEPRRRVFEALRAAGEPRTAQELAAAAGTSVASTYRVLGLLVALGVAGEVEDVAEPGGGAEWSGAAAGVENRVRRYALCTAEGHHHHFICRSCHAVLEVECEALERALAALGAETGLAIERHDVTLRGQCPRCREGVSA